MPISAAVLTRPAEAERVSPVAPSSGHRLRLDLALLVLGRVARRRRGEIGCRCTHEVHRLPELALRLPDGPARARHLAAPLRRGRVVGSDGASRLRRLDVAELARLDPRGCDLAAADNRGFVDLERVGALGGRPVGDDLGDEPLVIALQLAHLPLEVAQGAALGADDIGRRAPGPPAAPGRGFGLGAAINPSRMACLRAALRLRRTASAFSRVFRSDGFS